LKIIKILSAILMVVSFSMVGFADDNNGKAPQILTSDLMRKQIVDTDTLVVTFVFVDNDIIETVEINGQEEDIVPGTTVVVRKKFVFLPGRTLIKVKAIDEHDLAIEKFFLVGYKTDNDAEVNASDEQKNELSWTANLSIKYEYDDNPTNDASLPIKIGDLDLKGVMGGSLSVSYGSFSALLGFSETAYNKPENKFLNSRAIYMGLGLKADLGENIQYKLNYLYLDININTYDYSANHKVDTGFMFSNKDSEGYYKHYLGISYLQKEFAASDQDSGSQTAVVWIYDSLDAERLDLFKSNIAFGNSTEGNKESEITFSNWDFDWFNRWESGFKWDLGFGIQQREYKYAKPLSTETPFGEKRVDIPIRISNGFGWHFNDKWQAMYNYRYVFNLSNKTPYVRTIHGLAVNGRF